MQLEIVCKNCKGSMQVACKHEFAPIGDTGLQAMTLIPEGPQNAELAHGTMPKTLPAGYAFTYEHTTVQRHGKDVPAIKLYAYKLKADAAGAAITLQTKSKAELAELAVTLGVTDAVESWGKARLIGEIEKAQAAPPPNTSPPTK